MSHVQRRGKSWLVRWIDPDGTERSRSCSSRATARELQRDVDAAVEVGRRWEPRDARAIPGLRAVAEAWLRARSVRLAPRTLIRYGQMIEGWVAWMEVRHGARVTVSAVALRELEAYWMDLTTSGGRWGHARTVTTARKHLQAVHLWWEWASTREEYEQLVPRPRRLELPGKAAAAPAVAPSWAEMDAAIGAAHGWLRCLLIVLRCTGLRVGQAMGLRWSDLDEGRRVLIIRPELGKSASEQRGRVVPVAPVLLQELRAGELARWDPSGPWIVPSRPVPTGRGIERQAGTREARSRDAARAWKRAGVRVEVWRRRPDHAFRKGFVTGLRAAGAVPAAVEYLVGHRMPGEQEAYVDPWRALPLVEAVGMVPPLEVRGAS